MQETLLLQEFFVTGAMLLASLRQVIFTDFICNHIIFYVFNHIVHQWHFSKFTGLNFLSG